MQAPAVECSLVCDGVNPQRETAYDGDASLGQLACQTLGDYSAVGRYATAPHYGNARARKPGLWLGTEVKELFWRRGYIPQGCGIRVIVYRNLFYFHTNT